MSVRDALPRLHDIIEGIERVRGQTDGITLEAFEADWLRRRVVERGVIDPRG